MDPRSRAAVVNRWKNAVGDTPCPTAWESVSLTEQLVILDKDAESAAILQNRMDPDTEIAVLRGDLSDTATAQTLEQVLEATRAEFMDAAEQRMAADIEALQSRNAAQSAALESARQESVAIANAALAAQSRHLRGW